MIKGPIHIKEPHDERSPLQVAFFLVGGCQVAHKRDFMAIDEILDLLMGSVILEREIQQHKNTLFYTERNYFLGKKHQIGMPYRDSPRLRESL